jgi:hypothetical protein
VQNSVRTLTGTLKYRCANCQRYGHTKNCCHLKPRCVKCAGDHSTSQCPRKERSSDVWFVLCDGNYPANYKGCTVFKDLQKTYPPLRRKQYTPPHHYNKHCTPNLESHTLKSQSYTPTPQDTAPPHSVQQPPGDIHYLKLLMKTLFDQLSSMINLLNTVISKLP